jgi:hypothetical protein
VSRGLPVVSSRWIFDSFRAHALLDASAYKLRALEGLVICTTGLSAQTRVQIEKLAALHGAVYDANLEVGRTDILVAQTPSGPKYDAAMAHGISVVHVAWVHACIEKGELVDETAFSLETMLRPKWLYKQLCQELEDLSTSKMQQLLQRYWQQQGHDGENDEPEEFLELFDACGFFLVGFPLEMERQLQRLIRTGMGTIYYEMQLPAVSHVIVSPVLADVAVLERLEKLVVTRNATASCHFVSAKWIVDSLACLRLEPEEMYPVEIDEPMEEFLSPPLVDRQVSFASSSLSGLGDVSMDLLEGAEEDHEEEERDRKKTEKMVKLLKDYGFLLVCLDPDEPKLVRATVKQLQQKGGAQVVALDARDFEHVEPAQFDFVTHIVVCSGVSLNPELAETQRMKFAAYFQSLSSPKPTTGKPRRVRYVSDLWVRCCLAAECVVSHQTHELFTLTYQQPRSLFPVALPLACFKRVVASTSVYVGVDRLVVIELLRMAGAQVSSKLSKKNTHLICLNPIGMKFDKANEWGLTIVTARWVVQSVLQGEILDAGLPEFQVVDPDTTVGGGEGGGGGGGDASFSSGSGSRTTLGSGSRTTLGSIDPTRSESADAGTTTPASQADRVS